MFLWCTYIKQASNVILIFRVTAYVFSPCIWSFVVCFLQLYDCKVTFFSEQSPLKWRASISYSVNTPKQEVFVSFLQPEKKYGFTEFEVTLKNLSTGARQVVYTSQVRTWLYVHSWSCLKWKRGLTLSMLGKTFSRWYFEIFFLIFPRK